MKKLVTTGAFGYPVTHNKRVLGGVMPDGGKDSMNAIQIRRRLKELKGDDEDHFYSDLIGIKTNYFEVEASRLRKQLKKLETGKRPLHCLHISVPRR
jgi:hypothetical protein